MIKSFTFSYSLSFPKFHYKIQGRPVPMHANTIFCVIVILWYYFIILSSSIRTRCSFDAGTPYPQHTLHISKRIHNALILWRAGLSIIVSRFYCSIVPPNKRTFLQRGKGYTHTHTATGKRKRNMKIPTPGFLVNLRPIHLYILFTSIFLYLPTGTRVMCARVCM